MKDTSQERRKMEEKTGKVTTTLILKTTPKNSDDESCDQEDSGDSDFDDESYCRHIWKDSSMQRILAHDHFDVF